MTLSITMGQAFRGALETALREIGATNLRGAYTNGSTTWTVRADFPARTRARVVQRRLWIKWPTVRVEVWPSREDA